jgi:site-specific DNA-methyltransferase (adenine-specific)
VLASSNPNDLVVDPFGGSGTTYAVAEAFQRKWLGTEKEKEYCKTIKKRLQDTCHLQRIADNGEEAEVIERRRKLRGQ